MRTGRLEAFSDGVLAIIITSWCWSCATPMAPTSGTLWHGSGTGLLTYLLSFVYIGIYWVNHHHLFQLTERVTGGILWANLGLLFCLSLYPFTTNWMDTTGLATTPVVVYGINLLAAGIAYWILQGIIIGSQGPGSIMRRAVGRDFKGRGSMIGYVIACVVAAVAGDGPGRIGIWIAVGLFIAVAALWIIPDRRIETIVVADLEHGPGAGTDDREDPAEPGR